MFLKTPVIFNDNNYLDIPLKYKWNKGIDARICSGDHGKLLETLKLINHKAAFGLAIACSEWVFWRLSAHKDNELNRDMEFYFQFTEAHWLTLLDKKYLRVWDFQDDYKSYDKSKIETPCWIIANHFIYLRKDYEISSALIYPEMTTLILLARHISENETLFDHWLVECLKKASQLFPNQQSSQGGTVNGYDNSAESPIPREFFFDPDFNYEQADIEKLTTELLKEIGQQHASFLMIPEKNN